jgi:hypothetical protein
LRPASKEDSPRPFAKDDDCLPFTPALALAALPLKNRWEFGGALWNEPGFAARPDGLKLSRDGAMPILPATMLDCRRVASLMGD